MTTRCMQLDYVVGSELVFAEELMPPLMTVMNSLVTSDRFLLSAM